MLDVLDPDSDRGRVYRALTRLGRCRPDQLTEHTGLPAAVVGRVLGELADLDVVVRLDADTWAPRSPGLVMAELLRAEESRRERLWRAGAELDRLYHLAHRDDIAGVQAVPDPLELIALTRRLQERAAERIRWLDRPPYRSRPEDFREQEALQARRMAAGLRYRAVYHQAVYDDPDLFASMTRMVALGEDARVLADLPVKLTIGDDDTALLVPDPGGAGVSGALVVRTPGLLIALAGVFETLWTLGVPLTARGSGEPLSEQDRAIVTLMAAGVTDDVIARRLRLSRRTVVRRVAALLDRLGATTRFQAGVQAAHRGWL
ncbi:MAG TPA: helix-turn-helix transcriptional regulator [Actinophytocola sp.]|nr:helix-turn-helix transcriptional regulator [Actinophytocola sp.]